MTISTKSTIFVQSLWNLGGILTSWGNYFPQVSYELGKNCRFFTWALRFQNRLSYKITTLSQNFRHRNWNLQSTIALLSYTVKRLSCPRQQQQSGTNHDVAIFCAKTNEGQVQLRQSALHTISLMTHWWVNWDLENEFTGDH